MANELAHGSVGVGMTQAEFEAVGLHVLNSQATGDLVYASSATQLSRLGIGTVDQILKVISGLPSWQPQNYYPQGDANCKLYLPLYDYDLRDSPFDSKDQNAQVATVTGALWQPHAPGRYFDLTDDVISLPNPSLGIANGLSVVVWFKPSGITGNQSIVDIRAGNDSGEFALELTGADLYFYLLRDIAATYHGYKVTGAIAASTWYHVFITWAGGNISVAPLIYINGVSQTVVDGGSGGVDGATSNTTNTLRLGLKVTPTNAYGGIIGEASIYTSVLTASAVVNDYLGSRWRYA